MTEFQVFLKANMAAQNALRTQILDYDSAPAEYGTRSLARLRADLMALTVELNMRYLQEIKLHRPEPASARPRTADGRPVTPTRLKTALQKTAKLY
jgi:hypothetical protein